MATSPINNIVRSIAPKSLIEDAKPVLSSAVSYNQGDLIAFDTSSKLLKAIDATADAEFFLGVATQTVISGKTKSPYTGTAVDASQAIESVKGPVFGVICSLILKTGDAFAHLAPVYLVAANAQTVTSTDPGDGFSIGLYQGATVSSATAGQKGDVLVGARYGLAGLSI